MKLYHNFGIIGLLLYKQYLSIILSLKKGYGANRTLFLFVISVIEGPVSLMSLLVFSQRYLIFLLFLRQKNQTLYTS